MLNTCICENACSSSFCSDRLSSLVAALQMSATALNEDHCNHIPAEILSQGRTVRSSNQSGSRPVDVKPL